MGEPASPAPVSAVTKARAARVEELFDAALDLDEEGRRLLLAERCGDDAEVRREVNELLQHAGVESRVVVAPAIREAARATTERLGRPSHIGRFQILSRVGEGGMGTVFAAFDDQLDRRIAVKVLRHGDPMRLLREARSMARVTHPNVVTVHEVATDQGRVHIAMEFLDGATLREWITQEKRTWQAIVEMFVAAGRGLAAAHEAGVLHRDFKPDNVILGRDGRPRVVDFGLAALDARDDAHDARVEERAPDAELPLTLAGSVMGTPRYMSPEQVAGETATVASDQFNFCAALWEALFGVAPFGDSLASRRDDGDTLASIPSGSDVPQALAKAVARGLASAPAERWPSMQELLDDIDRYRRVGFDSDGGFSLRARRMSILILSVVGASSLLFMPPQKVEDAWALLKISSTVVLLMMVLTALFRDVFRQRLGRQLLMVGWAAVLGLVGNRVLGVVADAPVASVIAGDCLVFGVAYLLGAMLVRRQLAWAAAVCFALALACLQWPAFGVHFLFAMYAVTSFAMVGRMETRAEDASP